MYTLADIDRSGSMLGLLKFRTTFSKVLVPVLNTVVTHKIDQYQLLATFSSGHVFLTSMLFKKKKKKKKKKKREKKEKNSKKKQQTEGSVQLFKNKL